MTYRTFDEAIALANDARLTKRFFEEVKAFKEKIDARKKALETIKADFDRDRKRIAALMQKVKDAPMEDYNRLKSTYTLDGNGAMNVVGALFGEKIKGYLALGRKYYAMVSPYRNNFV